jgi:cell division protein FtsQ
VKAAIYLGSIWTSRGEFQMEADIIALRKKASLKRKKRFTLLIMILLISLSSTIIISVGVFDIKKVEVVGNQTLTKKEIIQWSQIILGKNVLKFKKSETIENLKKHPFIDEIIVNVILPDTIKITVSERSVAGAVSYLGSHVYIDKNGYILEITQGLDNLEYPLIINMEVSPPRVGNKISFMEKSSQDIIINILQVLREKEMLQTIKSISLDQYNNILLTCNRNNQIKILHDGDISYKIGFLEEILIYLQEKEVGAGYINMMHDGNPVYSPMKNWED